MFLFEAHSATILAAHPFPTLLAAAVATSPHVKLRKRLTICLPFVDNAVLPSAELHIVGPRGIHSAVEPALPLERASVAHEKSAAVFRI